MILESPLCFSNPTLAAFFSSIEDFLSSIIKFNRMQVSHSSKPSLARNLDALSLGISRMLSFAFFVKRSKMEALIPFPKVLECVKISLVSLRFAMLTWVSQLYFQATKECTKVDEIFWYVVGSAIPGLLWSDGGA